jgi:CubicO group peptidase (beta-lactamase class C family)
VVSPEDVGLCPVRLRRLSDCISRDVDDGRIPGAVVLIARHGQVAFFESFGFSDPDTRTTMSRGSLFRLASLTKPMTCVAAMTLVEKGDLLLDDPISKYIPEFEGLRAQAEQPGKQRLREATIHDLFRHTAGFTYGEFGSGAVHQSYQRLNVLDNAQTSREMAEKLSKIPLAYQPGTTFEYGMSTDVLGHIVERLTAQSLEDVLKSQILRPLDLGDTTFILDRRDHGRLAQAPRDRATAARPWMPVYHDSYDPPRWHSGGAGLLSTAHDYFQFMQMLLDGGIRHKHRVLASKSVDWMVSNHLPENVGYGDYMEALGMMSPTSERGQGFGLGFLVRLELGRNSVPGSIGDFSWAGVSGTYAWADPHEQLVVVLMMQAPGERIRYRALARNLVYQALLKNGANPSKGEPK